MIADELAKASMQHEIIEGWVAGIGQLVESNTNLEWIWLNLKQRLKSRLKQQESRLKQMIEQLIHQKEAP